MKILLDWIKKKAWPLACISAFVLGVAAAALYFRGDIARLKQTHSDYVAQAEREARQAAADVLEVERKGGELAAKLLAAEQSLTTARKERDDAIRNNTTGRPCLSGELVRLLNDSIPATGLKLPQASGQPAAADAAFAPHPPDPLPQGRGNVAEGEIEFWASDTDLALWAAAARDRYDYCRANQQALRRFYGLEP
ncbi:MAG: hypothetical protein LBL69_03765 [Zoogloeaceae bacterium]|jgi:hypothetical protein|nr:hypothetical protein [Zoogloeaceae bacterium]